MAFQCEEKKNFNKDTWLADCGDSTHMGNTDEGLLLMLQNALRV